MPEVIYRARILNPTSLEAVASWEDGALVVDAQGVIRDLGAYGEVEVRHPGSVILDLRPRWILPGLVDLHSHVPQYPEVARDGLELLPWLETHIFPAEARFADPDVATPIIRRFMADLIRLGTTTAVLYGTVHARTTDLIFSEAEVSGLRIVAGKSMMDWHAPATLRETTEASLGEAEELCQTWHGRRHGRLMYAFTPRFAPSCTPELMRGVARLSEKYGAYIQTHLSENLNELAYVRDIFPEAAHYTDVYRRMGLLSSRTLLAHGIHLSAEEHGMIRRAGASLVHCPASNAFLRSGIMPLRRVLDEGLKVGLGTDVGAGVGLSLWREAGTTCQVSKLRFALQQQGRQRLEAFPGLSAEQVEGLARHLEFEAERPLDAVEAFALATLGGARALGLDDRIGSLDPGKDADFVVVDASVPDPLGDNRRLDPRDVLGQLLYRPDPHMVRATFVRGQQCSPRID